MVAKAKPNGTGRDQSRQSMFLVIGIIIILFLVGACYWMMRGGDHHASKGKAACATEDLKLEPGQQSGAAGTIYQHMSLTNTGMHGCVLNGYPTAFLYGSDGYALGSGAAPRSQPAPATVTLAPGETAHTVLGYPQAGNFPAGQCSATKSVNVKIYPPAQTTPLTASIEVAWCPGFSITAMESGS